MIDKISINAHSSIRIASDLIIYFDPFHLSEELHDADLIFVTHEHFDHFSPEDIQKITKPDTMLIIPESIQETVLKAGYSSESILCVVPDAQYEIKGLSFETVPAYNIGRPFHPQENNWVGYIVTVEGKRIYVCGDTDGLEENKSVECDILIIPVGGTYTMTADAAADFANALEPKVAIPSHYGDIVGNPSDGQAFADALNKKIQPVILI